MRRGRIVCVALLALVAVLVLGATAARADPERLAGRYREGRVIPLPLVLSKQDGGVWSGIAQLTRGAPPWRLRLTPSDGGWDLHIEEPVPATTGVTGALAGERASGWVYDVRTVRLTERDTLLVGGGFELDRPHTAPPAPVPSPYDAGWFTDGDALPLPPDLRARVDRALAGGRSQDVLALSPADLGLTSPEEKALLVEHLLDDAPGEAERAFVVGLFDRYRAGGGPMAFADPLGDERRAEEGARLLSALVRRGRALDLVNEVDDPALYRLLPLHVRERSTAAALAAALAADDTDERRLAVHHVFDQARAGGYLEATLASLRGLPNDALQELVAQATPTRRPLVIAHRGGPPSVPENTCAAILAGVERGAEGVEVDVCVTRDGRIALWHDADPDDPVSLARNLSLEAGVGYRPTFPGLASQFRRPVHQLTVEELRRHFGYARRDDALTPGAAFDIPTLGEVAPYLAETAQLRRVVLDVKLPDLPDLPRRFASALRAILAGSPALAPKLVLMTPREGVLRGLRAALGPRLAYTLDVDLTALVPGDGSAVREAVRLRNSVASVGKPGLPMLGGAADHFLDVLRADRARIDRERLPVRLLAWTVNDELLLREVLAVGVDGVLTDDVALALDVLRRTGLAPR